MNYLRSSWCGRQVIKNNYLFISKTSYFQNCSMTQSQKGKWNTGSSIQSFWAGGRPQGPELLLTPFCLILFVRLEAHILNLWVVMGPLGFSFYNQGAEWPETFLIEYSVWEKYLTMLILAQSCSDVCRSLCNFPQILTSLLATLPPHPPHSPCFSSPCLPFSLPLSFSKSTSFTTVKFQRTFLRTLLVYL